MIKAVRNLTGLNLQQAKDIIDLYLINSIVIDLCLYDRDLEQKLIAVSKLGVVYAISPKTAHDMAPIIIRDGMFRQIPVAVAAARPVEATALAKPIINLTMNDHLRAAAILALSDNKDRAASMIVEILND